MPIINDNTFPEGSLGQTLRNSNTNNPVVYSQDVQGGLTNVDDETGLLALSPRLLQPGMLVHRDDNNTYWRFTYLVDHNANPTVRLMLRANGTFNYPTAPTGGASTLITSWQPLAFNNDEPAIIDDGSIVRLSRNGIAPEIRSLIGEGEEAIVADFPLTTTASNVDGTMWAGSATGVVTHANIGPNPQVYLNGVLLRRGATADYTVQLNTNAANSITLSSNIRGAIVNTNSWCLTIIDAIDQSNSALPTLTGTLDYVAPNVVSHTVPNTEYTAAVDAGNNMVSSTVNNAAGTRIASYTVVYIPGPPSAGDIEIRVTPIEGWTVESTAIQNFDRNPDNSYRHRFSLPAGPTTFRLVELIDTGLFFDAPNMNGRTKLSNDPITNATIDGLGYSTTNILDGRYEPLQDSTNPYINRITLTTTLNDYVTQNGLNDVIPITMTRGDTFPSTTNTNIDLQRQPVDGDQHYLTTNIYPSTVTRTQQVFAPGTGSGATTGQIEVTTTDPGTRETIIAGLVRVARDDRPQANRDISTAVSGATTYSTSGRNHGFNGFHLTRLVNAGGNTTNAIYVTESRGTDVRYQGNLVRNASWQNVHIRVQSANALGFANHIINDASYTAINFADDPAANVNTFLTSSNAIDMMLSYLSNSNGLTVGLTPNTSFASTVTTSASYTGGNIMVDTPQPTIEATSYEFIPQNGFAIDTGRSTIGGQSLDARSLSLTNNRLNAIINGAPMAWVADFVRTFRVPADPTTVEPVAPEGQYLYEGGWRRFMTTDVLTIPTN